MEISAPDWSRGKMCDVLGLMDNKGLRLIYVLWVSLMILQYGRIIHGPCCVLYLFTHGVSTFM